MGLAAWEREHGPRSHSHVPRSGTGMFPFPCYKMIPQVWNGNGNRNMAAKVMVVRRCYVSSVSGHFSDMLQAYVLSVLVVSDVCFNYLIWMLQK